MKFGALVDAKHKSRHLQRLSPPSTTQKADRRMKPQKSVSLKVYGLRLDPFLVVVEETGLQGSVAKTARPLQWG